MTRGTEYLMKLLRQHELKTDNISKQLSFTKDYRVIKLFHGLSSLQQYIDVPCGLAWPTRLVLQIPDLPHNKFDFSLLVAIVLQ